MAEILSTELKSDLEDVYRKAGNLLDVLEDRSFDREREDIRELMEVIRFRLEDICGTLQKDIFNCDYLITKYKVLHLS